MNLKKHILFLLFAVLILSAATGVTAQRRDHLTNEEIELVRDVQDVDLRMELFVKAIERRLWVLDGAENLSEVQRKRIRKDLDKWGDLPAGTRLQLFSDIGKILDEAVDKLEDVYEQDNKSELIPFAYEVIANYSESLIPKLETLAEKTSDAAELAQLEYAAQKCNGILEVRDTVPKPVGKRKKSKKT